MCVYIYGTSPKDLPFLAYLFEILWFGMIIEQLIERGDHIYIIIYRYIFKIYLNKHVYIYTGICTSHKNANFANFPGFKIQDSGENFLNPGLVMDSRSKKFFPTILNLESQKSCKLCKLSWIQDSRFWGKLLESRPGLGFKKFFPESWIPKQKQTLQTFLDSRFWGKLLESSPGLGFNKFFPESWILSSKQMQTLQTFLDP